MTTPKYTAQEVGEYYDQMAHYYRLAWGGSLHVGYWHDDAPDAPLAEAQENLTDLMIAQTPVGPAHTVLDVGCGYGRPGTKLAEKTGCRVVGITISEVQAAEANRYAAERGVTDRVLFHRMDAMAPTFGDASFDAAWAFECLFHMPDRAQVLREIARVLRPGGRLVLTDSYMVGTLEGPEVQMVYDGYKVNAFMSPAQYGELLPTLGYRVIETRDISKNTAPTVTHVAAAAAARADALQAAYGQEFVAAMEQASPFLDRVSREKLCYFQIAAEKV